LLYHSLSELNSSAKGYGISLGINYYLTSLYSGFWAELAPGINFLQHRTDGNITRSTFASVLANVGWRSQLLSGMSFGVGGGLNYIFYDEKTSKNLGSSRLYTSIVIDFGYAF
jgi:hypothetical protein